MRMTRCDSVRRNIGVIGYCDSGWFVAGVGRYLVGRSCFNPLPVEAQLKSLSRWLSPDNLSHLPGTILQ